ncbi:MAG: TetR/AcrR family transcriptional regulator [Caldilineaceae bacterium]
MKTNEELTPRERRYQRTQQAILDAALALIREKGVDGLSIRAIADRIDYSPAGLYEYYGSKEEIIEALCMQGLERFGRYLASVEPSLSAEKYMEALGLAYIDFAVKNADFFLLMFTLAPMQYSQYINNTTSSAEENLNQDHAFMTLVHGVERCVAEGIFQLKPNFGVLEMARTFWSMSHGIAMLQLTVLQQMPATEETIRQMFRAIFEGIRQR